MFLVLLGAVFLISCQSDEAALQNDPGTKTEVNRIMRELAAGKKVSQEDVDAINKISEKYPTAESVRQARQAILINRQDWAELEKFFNEKPAAELTAEDKLNLGKVYFKLGRFDEAAAALEPLQSPGNIEATSLLATVYFQMGKYDQAKQILDGSWENILSGKRTDDMVTRGMIYFYQGEKEPAIAMLEKALAIEPEKISANNGLSRIYAAQGDEEKAAEYLARVQKEFDRITTEEQTRTKMVAQMYKLQDAYQNRRFQEVVEIGEAIIPQVDAGNKLALYQYLYNSYQNLGKTREAEEVLVKVKELQTK